MSHIMNAFRRHDLKYKVKFREMGVTSNKQHVQQIFLWQVSPLSGYLYFTITLVSSTTKSKVQPDKQ